MLADPLCLTAREKPGGFTFSLLISSRAAPRPDPHLTLLLGSLNSVADDKHGSGLIRTAAAAALAEDGASWGGDAEQGKLAGRMARLLGSLLTDQASH